MNLTITVPIPSFNPNNNFAGWMAKASQKKKDRERAEEETMCAVTELGDWKSYNFPWHSASVQVRWYHKTANHRDPDNIIASLKPTIDGVRRAGVLVNDDELVYLPPERLTDGASPRVEVVLERSEA